MDQARTVDASPWLHRLLLVLLFTNLAAYPALFFGFGTGSVDEVRIVEALGSKQPEDRRRRGPVRAFDGRLDRSFITDTPDGKAFVGLKFNRPTQVREIVLHSGESGKAATRVVAARIQWSDDGIGWSDAGPSRRNESGRLSLPVSISGEAQPHPFWRALVEETDSADITVIREAEIQFERNGSGATRSTLQFEWCILLLLAASMVLYLIHRAYISPKIAKHFIFASASLFFIVYANYYFVVTNGIVAIVESDTSSYLSFAIHRTIGYPTFLSIVKFLSSYLWIGPIQLNIFAVSSVLLAYSIYIYSKSIGFSVAFLMLIFVNGYGFLYSIYFLTESLFVSLLNVLVAAMLLYFRGQSAAKVVVAGMVLALLTTVKSIGPAIAFASLVFIVIASPRRVFFTVCCALPIAAASLGMAGNNYVRYDVFSSSPIGGLAIAGQAGPLIHENQGSRYPDVAKGIREAMEPVISRRPEFTSVEEYYRYTAREYGEVLFRTLVPVVKEHLAKSGGDLSPVQYKIELNRIASDLAFHAIIARPLDYAWHVFAHYYGLWLDGKHAFGGWERGRSHLHRIFREQYLDDRWNARYRRVLGPDYMDEAFGFGTPMVTQVQVGWAFVSHKFAKIWVQILPYLGVFSFFYPFWFVAVSLAGRRWFLSQPVLFLTLLLNAYSLGHALFQVSLPRYAGIMYVPQLLLALLLLCAAVSTIARLAGPNWRQEIRRRYRVFHLWS